MPDPTDKSQTIYKSRKQLLIDNFLSGIMWGLGTVIGASLVVTVIGIIIARSQQLPLIGSYINSVVSQLSESASQSEMELNLDQ